MVKPYIAGGALFGQSRQHRTTRYYLEAYRREEKLGASPGSLLWVAKTHRRRPLGTDGFSVDALGSVVRRRDISGLKMAPHAIASCSRR
jgi:hypothetical protein